jgi:hypothetical protein
LAPVSSGPFSNPDSARTEIMQMAMEHAAVPTGVPKPDTISANMANLTIFQGNVARVIGHDYGGNTKGGLAITMSFGRQNILRVLKLQSAQRECCTGPLVSPLK